MPNKKPKTPIQLRREADTLWSRATRYRFCEPTANGWVGKCVTCGQKLPFKKLQCGHFQSRKFNATRFSEENTAIQCMGCNVFKYGEQYKFGLWVDSFYGTGTAKRLVKEAQAYHKFTRQELEEIIANAKEQIKYYENLTEEL